MNYKLFDRAGGAPTTLQQGDRIIYDLEKWIITVKRGSNKLYFEGGTPSAEGGYHTGKHFSSDRAADIFRLIAEFAAATAGLNAVQVYEEKPLEEEVIFELQ